MEETLSPVTQVQQTPPEKAPDAKPIMPPKPKTPLLVILIVLIPTLIGATGYLAYQNYQLKQQISQLQTAPTPSPTPDPIVSWITYTNQNNLFSFKYPPNMNISISGEENVFYVETENYKPLTTDSYQIQITTVKDNVPALEDYVNQLVPNTPEYDFLDKQQEKEINSIKAIERIYKSEWEHYKEYYLRNNILGLYLKGTGGNHDVLDQILSTFKFLDPEESVETQIRNFINQYMETIINEDWEKFKDYLTQSIQEEFVETSAPIGISSYNILSIEGPNQQGQYIVTVQMLDNNGSILKQPPGTDPQIFVLQEEGAWKSLTWYLFP